jgi:aminopeptidase N
VARLDPHSVHDTDQPQVTALEWRARIDPTARTVEAEALLRFADDAAGAVDVDTRELAIEAVTDETGAALAHALDAPHPIRGARLRVERPAGTAVRIAYRTAPTASALHWLDEGVYTQCQTIHARSLVPLPDTPRVRLRLHAELTAPSTLMTLMAAKLTARRDAGGWSTTTWTLDAPIPPYLLAFAVGHVMPCPVGPRSQVWAAPALVERAAAALADVEDMMRAAEALFGPYPWERFDVLVMPSMFPFGGMENPRLAFLAPSLLAGGRHVIAHELAHAWTGNLVTNASAEHFWLNEGFTVYAERRIVEALDGAAAAALHAARGRRDLTRALDELRAWPDLTRLRLWLDGLHPDDTLSIVAYEKGYAFLRALEDAVGRTRFDAFLRAYLARFRFRSLTTEEWLAFAAEALPDALARVDARRWLDEPGVPEPLTPAPSPPAAPRSAVEWQLWLGALPRPLDAARCAALDAAHALTAHEDTDVLVEWLPLAVEAGYAPATARVEALVGAVGRIRILKPLYQALARRPDARALAASLFRRHEARYHPLARRAIDTLLRHEGVATVEANPLAIGRGRRDRPI